MRAVVLTLQRFLLQHIRCHPCYSGCKTAIPSHRGKWTRSSGRLPAFLQGQFKVDKYQWAVGCSTVHPIQRAAARNVHVVAAGPAVPAAPHGPPAPGLTPQQEEQVERFLDILLEQNQHMNLTAVRDRSVALVRHVQDSLALLPVLDAHLLRGGGPPSVIDVGSGAGLPGVILAIARPDWQFTLLDTLKKRCVFVEQTAHAVGLRNVQTAWMRAEDAGRQETMRESYNVAVARAVAEMRVLAELCLPLVRVGGHVFAAKGANPQAEVDAASSAILLLGGSLVGIEPVDSHGPDGQRTVAVIHKVLATPEKYPRKAGQPQKRPL
ncbi:hypothetical protein WJX72_001820 [[Myrmecia] bisecta]|uniref:Ribosomal RNA small subunit methyltransferase G n=1 Tax=[Myrmecia] bisecta TaxID=41462 RepID=A0AAW1R4K7_9CHLO